MFSFIKKLFFNFFNFVKSFFKLFLFLFFKLFSLFNSQFSNKLLPNNAQSINYNYYSTNDFKSSLQFFVFGERSFLIFDLLGFFFLSLKYKITDNSTNVFRSYFRALSTKNGFYFNFELLKKNNLFIDTFKHIFMSGLRSI